MEWLPGATKSGCTECHHGGREDIENNIFATPFSALPEVLQNAFGSERNWKQLISSDFQHEMTSNYNIQFFIKYTKLM